MAKINQEQITAQITALEAELELYQQNKPSGMEYQTFLVWNKGVKSLKSKITRRERKLSPIMSKADFDVLYAKCYKVYDDYYVCDVRESKKALLSDWQDKQLASLEAMIWRSL